MTTALTGRILAMQTRRIGPAPNYTQQGVGARSVSSQHHLLGVGFGEDTALSWMQERFLWQPEEWVVCSRT